MSIDQHTISLDTALQMRATDAVPVLAGGTDYYPGLNDASPVAVALNLNNVSGLNTITQLDDHWRIGATVTWAELIAATLPACFDGLKQAGREVGSMQIQNAASLVGNLCNASPAADGVPALLVLNANVELSSVNGVRLVPLSAFITGVRTTLCRSNEIVTAILIPNQLNNDHTSFAKLGSRTYLVISIVMSAVRLRVAHNVITEAAVAVGACSPVAQRLPLLEQALLGKPCTQAALAHCVEDEHVQTLSPITDVRASAAYRLRAAKIMLQRQIHACAARVDERTST